MYYGIGGTILIILVVLFLLGASNAARFRLNAGDVASQRRPGDDAGHAQGLIAELHRDAPLEHVADRAAGQAAVR